MVQTGFAWVRASFKCSKRVFLGWGGIVIAPNKKKLGRPSFYENKHIMFKQL